MKLTVLFDLDDTLLHTNTREFLPAYFKGLSRTLSFLGSKTKITEQIRYAVGEMVANQDPSKKLRDVFTENFYSALESTEKECQESLRKFYTEEFPKLAALIEPKPEARPLIEWCKTQKMVLAIATNPLFPETATRQRILWSGLDPQDFQFFSTCDNFHFAKPNISYFSEALGRLGWPEGPIVMVGDNLSHDMIPIEKMGLHSFWIDPEEKSTKRPHGSLSEVRQFLANIQAENQQSKIKSDPEVAIAILRSTPAVIDTWLERYNRKKLHQQPAEGEWSANEIFWHLADFEERIYKPQWQNLLRNPDQVVPHIETSSWAEERDYASRKPEAAYARFLESRTASLELIEALLDKGFFELSIDHTVFSKAKISELVDFSARHDRLHLRQSVEALKF